MQLAALMLAAIAATPITATRHSTHDGERDYLPDEAASKAVTVTAGEQSADAAITILTPAVAIKETGPKQTVARFGEVYIFAPSFIAIHRDQPTALSFWNLQADDAHDFMLTDPDLNVLMKVTLPALRKTSYVFSFHREGLFDFYCTMHQPAMVARFWYCRPPRGRAPEHATSRMSNSARVAAAVEHWQKNGVTSAARRGGDRCRLHRRDGFRHGDLRRDHSRQRRTARGTRRAVLPGDPAALLERSL